MNDEIQPSDRPEVETMTGQHIRLMDNREKVYYELARDKYKAEYEFTMANDYRTLDRLLLMEVQCFRFQWWTAAGQDYDGTFLTSKEDIEYRRALKEILNQIQEMQESLGVSKAQRDKATVDDVGTYIVNLQQAAKAHGVKREKELGKGIELCKELFALVGAYLRSNELERRKLGFESAEDILNWISEYMKPSFDAVDEHFRHSEQRFFVGNL